MARRIVPAAHPESPRIRTAADLGAFIRAQRTEQGLRIDDAAMLCGVSVALLSALENGSERGVALNKALHIAQQLGLDVLVASRRNSADLESCLDRKL
jgi:transcriptional regulator with XRE-family HTH domain